ncbi:MAG: hypothetical protein Q6373_025630, partial [Candidatus Sigynarchaeota archaeon]
MAKKNSLAELLGGFRAGTRNERREATEQGDAGDAVTPEIPRAKKAPGILDPIMALLTPEEKFQFLSGLMDFIGDFIVNMLDQYTFELGKVESSISNLQSTVLNQVRTIRNQVDIARQQGHFKALEGPPVPPGLAGTLQGNMIAAAAAAVGSSDEPRKRREATERDVMDIAASIRTLITRQKMAKPAATQPATDEAAIKAETAQETTGKASLDTKLQQFQKSADEQKQRIDRIASTAKPTTARATQALTQQPEKTPVQAKQEKPAKPAKSASRKKQGTP